MRAEHYRNTDGADLQRQTQEAQEQMFRYRFQMGMGQTEGLTKYRALKKDRARMLTVLREKNLAELEVKPVSAAALQAEKKSGKKKKAKK